MLLVLGREETRVPELDEIESLVRAEWTRRSGERALRAYLEELKARADLVR